ncbi:MAG: hypothetical protein AAF799_14025 [Myxococcota bacterium]
MMSSDQRRFSDEESALILQRAAEMQAQRGQQLSLPEIESAAAEAGIDVALVRRAATELATRPSTPPPPAVPIGGGVLGAPMQLIEERTVMGPLARTAWEDAMGEIHRQLGIKGQVDDLGRQFVWSHPKTRDLRISIAPRGDHHIIRVEEKLTPVASGLYVGMALPITLASLGFIIPVSIVALKLPALIPSFFLMWAGMAFMLARTIFKSSARNRDRQVRALAEGLVATCEAGTRSLPPATDES